MCVCVSQAYAKKSALKGGLDKTMSLRKEMQEMQEWISQAEEDYLERDFTYHTPEELRRAVEELKVGGERECACSLYLCVLQGKRESVCRVHLFERWCVACLFEKGRVCKREIKEEKDRERE